MRVLVQPGETLTIGFADEDGNEQDGEFKLFFDTKEHPNAVILQETAGLPGSVCGNAGAILYHEQFGVPADSSIVPADQKG